MDYEETLQDPTNTNHRQSRSKRVEATGFKSNPLNSSTTRKTPITSPPVEPMMNARKRSKNSLMKYSVAKSGSRGEYASTKKSDNEAINNFIN